MHPVVVRGGGLLISRPRMVSITYPRNAVKCFFVFCGFFTKKTGRGAFGVPAAGYFAVFSYIKKM